LNIKQETHKVQEDKKYEFLMSELEQRKGSIVIFVKTKHGADRLAAKLAREEHRAAAIHGDLQQRKRDRVIAEFREKRFRILVATDVAARGLDIPHIEHVINYDMPQVPEDYIHRVGRTARAGATGSAVNFVTAADSRKWQAIQKLLGGDTDTQDAKASRGVKRGGGDRARGALPRRAGKPGGGFGGGPGRREAPGGRDSRDSRDSRESTSPRAPRANQPWNPRGEERESPREARSDARPDTRPDARPAPRAGAAPFGKKPARAATGAPKARWGKDRKDAARSAKPAFAGPRSKRRPA
jgi:superfamily II DNA/RNA helicase